MYAAQRAHWFSFFILFADLTATTQLHSRARQKEAGVT
jgi:hypothetical protein